MPAVEAVEPEAREAMKSYWVEHSAGAHTVEAMMLDQGAGKIDALERPEILGMLPEGIADMEMIEMGAGIGRLTGDLAKMAKRVVACDFVEETIRVNEANNAHHGNCEFLCADATKLEQGAESLDIVFSNWLLMYFTDAEVCELFAKALTWLRPGGYLFFRESCFHRSGNAKRGDNPTVYRTPAQYHRMVCQQQMPDAADAGTQCAFELVSQKTVKAYVDLKDNHNQVAWLYQKKGGVVRSALKGMALQEFLDTRRYTEESILAYERMYGEGHISVGGMTTSAELVGSMGLKPGQRILDVGCGLGGGWQKLAYEYEVNVLGVDLSVNMINGALERRIPAAAGVPQRVAFEVADVMEREFEADSFDVIYSRDAILHVEDKPALFARLLRWLKPGGRLLLTDYCCGEEKELSRDFIDNAVRRGYFLTTPEDYGTVVESVGFASVSAADTTDSLTAIMETELARISQPEAKAAFIADFSAADYYQLLEGWNAKLKWAAASQFKWVRLDATKPALGAQGSLVDCSQVVVKHDAYGGAGAFAACDIANGDVVERGIVRVLTNVNGHENPYVFTWSDTLPNTTWAIGSGSSTFYNTCADDAVANTHMERFFEEGRFVIRATKDIKEGDELLHVYKSKKWRECFSTMPGNEKELVCDTQAQRDAISAANAAMIANCE